MTTYNDDTLQSLNIQDSYRSNDLTADIVNDFYIPVLSVGIRYDRAVGYFSSSSLRLFGRGLENFRHTGGKIRLIASPQLTAEDYESIIKGYELRAVVEKRANLDFEQFADEITEELSLLASMIKNGELDIKLAVVSNSKNVGIYHEKIGIIKDSDNNKIAFTGSANETFGGLQANYESIEVFKNWTPEASRVERIESNFNSLWNNETHGLSVYAASKLESRLVKFVENRRDAIAGPTDQSPIKIVPRPYQKHAINEWIKNRFCGILAMATGTGKTKTAIFGALHLADLIRKRDKRLLVVVVVPYSNLVHQWYEDISNFSRNAVKVYDSHHSWRIQAKEKIRSLQRGNLTELFLIATNSSFANRPLQDLLEDFDGELLLIADEAHHLGAAWARDKLPSKAKYRLALSATPVRHNDTEGTEFLNNYFNRIVYELPMDEAISKGFLSQYRYYPRIAELSDEESSLYERISVKISNAIRRGASLEDPDSNLGSLLRQRTNVLDHAAAKIPLFLQDMSMNRNEFFQLIYCAEGTSSLEPRDAGRQVERITRQLSDDLGLLIHSYHSGTHGDLRNETLDSFTKKHIQAISSMKCLDEGVDIPSARIGYLLASSSNPRQFIQRRGRLLRKAPGKTEALIYDYLAMPPLGMLSEMKAFERKIVQRELARASEFASLAINSGESLASLRDIKEKYNLFSV